MLTKEQKDRYHRQIILPEVGEKGQKKLLNAKVLLIGTGGLGSAAAYYLAAAGVGKIGLVDGDHLERSNLQRQILHQTSRLGELKVVSARQTLTALNPEIEITTYQENLTAINAPRLIQGYDLVVDCSDNFTTRYLINKTCVIKQKPMIYGAVSHFEGQAMTILPGAGPCYGCLYPEPPLGEAVPSCREIGILGVLPGLIGVVQATEALKFILQQGKLLVGELLIYNALNLEYFKVKIKRNPRCSICGINNK
ncbi:MAG: molybdopterin-synthase adenylyltransferase MoeB [Peptococcaceae bacterium]